MSLRQTRRAIALLLFALPGTAVAQAPSSAAAQAPSPAAANPGPAVKRPATAKAAPITLPAAFKQLAVGRYAEAEERFRALAEGAQRGSALLGLGRVLIETGRYDEAEATGAAAAAVPGFEARGQTLRGEALLLRGRLDEAEQALSRAVRAKTALRARVLLGRLLKDRGRKTDAETQLMAVIDAYNEDVVREGDAAGLAYVAMAARALGSMHDANDAFREAALADRSRVETQLEWASLFLEKYDQAHAAESVQEALEHNPNSPVAHVLMARLALARAIDFLAAVEHLDKAQAVNPNLVIAHVTRAAMALREMDIENADRHLDAALLVNPHDLEALSVRAAARFLADDEGGFAQAKREVLRRNARYSRMFSIIAEYAEWEHRYDELVAMAREALKLDPEDALAHATLGMNLLRAGEEESGVAALRDAWKRDRFNAQVFNLLNFYEQVLEQQYVVFPAPPFLFRTHKEERVALEPYVVPALSRAYEDMRKRYAFTPRGPLRIELYADPQHFSVRTTGLPNVGVQGVCFGKVITALSPRGGPFNWGQITWHELAHVFHLQLSKNRVPRWFTEGLAEYETIVARPEWKREEDYELWTALKQDRVPRLRDFNKAFTQARTPEALMTAYYAASQAVVYIVERFGFDKVRPMLEAFGRGQRTPDVIARVLGVDIDALDRDFRAHTARRLAKYDDHFFVDFDRYGDLDALRAAVKRAPDDADALAGLSLGLVMRGAFAEADKLGAQALARAPRHPIANFARTRTALERGDAKAAQKYLRAMVAGGKDGYIVRVLLARAALSGGDTAGARREAEAAIALDPDQVEAHRILLELSDKLGDQALALVAVRALADLDQHDKLVHLALMAALQQQKAYADLVEAGERALYLDPSEPRIHSLLGEGYLETGKPEQAMIELDRARALFGNAPGSLHMLRARALAAVGKRKEAVRAAAEAIAADPKLKEAAELLIAPQKR
jgi:cellulose synthase operon protein C